MRFTPILIVYLVLLFMMTMIMRELNQCTQELQRVINETKTTQRSTNSPN